MYHYDPFARVHTTPVKRPKPRPKFIFSWRDLTRLDLTAHRERNGALTIVGDLENLHALRDDVSRRSGIELVITLVHVVAGESLPGYPRITLHPQTAALVDLSAK